MDEMAIANCKLGYLPGWREWRPLAESIAHQASISGYLINNIGVIPKPDNPLQRTLRGAGFSKKRSKEKFAESPISFCRSTELFGGMPKPFWRPFELFKWSKRAKSDPRNFVRGPTISSRPHFELFFGMKVQDRRHVEEFFGLTFRQRQYCELFFALPF